LPFDDGILPLEYVIGKLEVENLRLFWLLLLLSSGTIACCWGCSSRGGGSANAGTEQISKNTEKIINFGKLMDINQLQYCYFLFR
jgi:hypothetical protein